MLRSTVVELYEGLVRMYTFFAGAVFRVGGEACSPNVQLLLVDQCPAEKFDHNTIAYDTGL